MSSLGKVLLISTSYCVFKAIIYESQNRKFQKMFDFYKNVPFFNMKEHSLKSLFHSAHYPNKVPSWWKLRYSRMKVRISATPSSPPLSLNKTNFSFSRLPRPSGMSLSSFMISKNVISTGAEHKGYLNTKYSFFGLNQLEQ